MSELRLDIKVTAQNISDVIKLLINWKLHLSYAILVLTNTWSKEINL